MPPNLNKLLSAILVLTQLNLLVLQSSFAFTSSLSDAAIFTSTRSIHVTGDVDATITYIDPGKGKDKQNEVFTLNKADFLKGWKGKLRGQVSS